MSYGYTLLKYHVAVSVGITFIPLEGYHNRLFPWVYQKHEQSFIEYGKMFGFFCAVSWLSCGLCTASQRQAVLSPARDLWRVLWASTGLLWAFPVASG